MRPGEETTIEEWEERFRKDVQRRPGWSVLPIEMLFSQAYRSLSGSAQLALQFALSQVSWEKTRRPGKRKKLKNDTIYLPTNALLALGIKSSSTRTALRKDLVQKGFLDVMKTGSYLNCAVFKASGRWRHYPNGDYKPQDQPLPGICMGHRFNSEKVGIDPEETSPRSENERKGDSIFERKEIPEKPLEDSSLRLNIERKALRSEIKRTVLCTMAEQGSDVQEVHVQENMEEEIKDPSHNFSGTPEENQDSSLKPMNCNEENPVESKLTVIQNQWFIDSFSSACSEIGIDPNRTLSPELASILDEWLTRRLSKKSYLGNRCFYDEKPHHFTEKIKQIVCEWESLRISSLGRRMGTPADPDLDFLVTNREAIFDWISEQRRQSVNRILEQFETKEPYAGYAH